MNIKDRMILADFKKEKENFIKLEQIVSNKLREIVSSSNVLTTGIEHRVKTESSLEGKLYKNGDFYQNLSDLTDLLGARIICYFSDGVDVIGKKIEEEFDIDLKLSSDKRALIKADRFGYLSLHYICSLKKEQGYAEELTNKKFEIQIRSILQHAWAAICHDLGYKTEFGIPRSVVRQFARLAGLLELADDEFVRTRENIFSYTENIRNKIINDDAQDVLIDIISLREYMQKNKKMQEFIAKIADIEGSEITYVVPDSYIEQLAFLKIKTIGDLQRALKLTEKTAYKLAYKSLKGSELDILTSNTALRFLTRAYLVRNGYKENQIANFIMLTTSNEARATRQAKALLKSYEEIKGEL